MFLSNFHMHKKKILNCNIREISNQQEPKESTNVYRKKGQTGDSNLLQYGSSQQLLFAEKSPHTKQLKPAFLLKQKHFYMLMLNQYSHLDSHASHHELCCKVGNKTHLSSMGTQLSDHPCFCFFNLHKSTMQTYRNIALPINRKPRN